MEADKTENVPSRPMVQFWLGPHNEGLLDHPDSVGRVTGPCGDTMEISLKIDHNKILDSRFQVQGCAVSKACASIAAAMAKGKELEEAWDIDEGQISGILKDIPADHLHCPVLARDTLRQAIENYLKQSRGREPGAESGELRAESKEGDD
ncbi:MAG: iron-sulfur cluster assembly scaffold protein [Thermodesulfobacteriota bacterium]